MQKMNLQNKIDQLLQFVLLAAGQEDDFVDRWLGPIHLIKYVYLADLTFAKYHQGETYTGLTWRFHHFGPWSVECYRRIEPALGAINAQRKTIESKNYDDFVRWYADDSDMFEQLRDEMELGLAGILQKYVREFGNDTYGLLDFVYKTEPMLKAAPEEVLDLRHSSTVVGYSEKGDEEARAELSDRKKKTLAT